jgi:hypothetical protein
VLEVLRFCSLTDERLYRWLEVLRPVGGDARSAFLALRSVHIGEVGEKFVAALASVLEERAACGLRPDALRVTFFRGSHTKGDVADATRMLSSWAQDVQIVLQDEPVDDPASLDFDGVDNFSLF